MAKSKKANPKPSDLKQTAIALIKEKTGWGEVKITNLGTRISTDGTVAQEFSGQHPKAQHLNSVSVFLSNEGKVVASDLFDYQLVIPTTKPQADIEAVVLNSKDCSLYGYAVNQYLQNYNRIKYHQMKACSPKHDNCGCSNLLNEQPKIDLVILMDTSGSMRNHALNISNAAESALSKLDCKTDLRVQWLGIGGVIGGTKFTEKSGDYLFNHGYCKDLVTPPSSGREEGARTIIDVSNCFNWRKDACRTIFYISDEAIHRGDPNDQHDDEQTQLAIAAANANQVTVFSHYIAGKEQDNAAQQNYLNLSTQTGGEAFISPNASVEAYSQMLNQVVCNACGKCQTMDWSKIKPCITVKWGDSACDCMETDDFEVLSISVCNCFDNVLFEDVVIHYIQVTDEQGNPVPLLPDGTPSVEVYPIGPICFDNIPPCQNRKPSCITRQVVLRTRGAKSGNYRLKIGKVCYKASHLDTLDACFSFSLCKDN